ncbi:antA/AntB antirepressor family protein [Spirosoma sp. BT702]|uniref:AntA/AntB antirepressor family protein n=1 Tax=Spirosoma profusum TaxID=2771354 RepID=A0A926Y1S8_9BACT|nr:antA/AntB antirepressor family protein [Spirosoma profusum]MBD2704440.1 antA/AntB antirepressor family protein [Spirosoma profusum]
MQQYIHVYPATSGDFIISGRSLCIAFSGYKDPKDQFCNWINNRVKTLGLVENTDYIKTKIQHPDTGRKVLEYVLTIDAAILLAKEDRSPWAEGELTRIKNGETDEPTESPVHVNQVNDDTNPPTPAGDTQPVERDENDEQLTPAQRLLKQAIAAVEAEKNHKPSNVETRLVELEGKLDAVLTFFQLASQTLFSKTGTAITTVSAKVAFEIANTKPDDAALLVSDSDRPVNPESTRGKVVEIVKAYGQSKNIEYRRVWTWLYGQMLAIYDFNAALHRTNTKEPYIEAVEREGQIDNLHAIASKYLQTAS